MNLPKYSYPIVLAAIESDEPVVQNSAETAAQPGFTHRQSRIQENVKSLFNLFILISLNLEEKKCLNFNFNFKKSDLILKIRAGFELWFDT